LTGAEKNLENALIYVDKEGCGECKEASVVIDNIGKAYDMPIYHYNTIYDTDDNMEELKQVLEGYKITSVPAVVLIKNGKYETTFYSEEIKTDKVQIYLKENSDFFTKK
ncbi:MAG: thioredoxin family protein, partial [Oscillospiraceae bacterium]